MSNLVSLVVLLFVVFFFIYLISFFICFGLFANLHGNTALMRKDHVTQLQLELIHPFLWLTFSVPPYIYGTPYLTAGAAGAGSPGVPGVQIQASQLASLAAATNQFYEYQVWIDLYKRYLFRFTEDGVC